MYIGEHTDGRECFSSRYPSQMEDDFCGEHPSFGEYLASLKVQIAPLS